MGCGISSYEREDGTLDHHPKLVGVKKIVAPASDNNLATKQLLENDANDDHDIDSQPIQNRKSVSSVAKNILFVLKQSSMQDVKTKYVDSKKNNVKEYGVTKKLEAEKENNHVGKHEEGKKVGKFEKDEQNQVEWEEEHHYDGRNSLIYPGSPSFREYCTDYGSVDPIYGDTESESGDSTKNDGISESAMIKSEKQDALNPRKDSMGKKERKGRGFRKALQKGMSGGKKVV
ncbi:hypothetical protein O6P43_009728 [Quillaja saponaria]|uniref:Uncharacterized protein n=1 Tax=Quillaja saponaria TaxID=32244 RepID=A0AAD7PYY8_QUISA|nr:hypothetical protein O6P43_009728 [Quillaja saponaria]